MMPDLVQNSYENLNNESHNKDVKSLDRTLSDTIRFLHIKITYKTNNISNKLK